MYLPMAPIMTYRGREIHPEDLGFIRNLIASHPQACRQELSRLLCRAWSWVQPNGQLKDMICRGLMLRLQERGLIQLPPPRSRHTPQGRHLRRPAPVPVDDSPLRGSLAELGAITLRQVRRTPQEQIVSGLIESHHYLGFRQPVGEHLLYLAIAKDRPIACLAFCSSTFRLAPRDRFIGWSDTVRAKNLHLLAYNTRFLILPWVQVRHLASHLLGAITRLLSADWNALYHHPIYWLETMVDTSRFAGTCYKAANWLMLGKSSGRGLRTKHTDPLRTIKDIYGYPLTSDFQQRLCHG
jgi:hypothetical protein